MYITGTTTMLGVVQNGAAPFPLFNAQQSCLNESGKTSCTSQTPTTTPDAFVAKINPYQAGSNPVYSTYIGGSGDDYGNAIDVDTSGTPTSPVGPTRPTGLAATAAPLNFSPLTGVGKTPSSLRSA